MARLRPLELVCALLALVTLLLVGFTVPGQFGGSDSIQHFQIAQYSFKHPELFLHHWGKPLFTLLSSPFAQFGITGVELFNMLVMVTTTLLVFRMLRAHFNLDLWLAIPFMFVVPVYLESAYSALTEPLFGLVITAALYAAQKNNWALSAFVIGFLPMARTEGSMMLPLWATAMLMMGHWRKLPWLAAGILIYSLVGTLHYGDLYWLYTESPYSKAISYGSGRFWHYWEMREDWAGPFFISIFLLGVLVLAAQLIWKDRSNWRRYLPFGMAAVGAIGYFGAHSYLWYKGSSGALGLLRIMGGIVPMMALVGLFGVAQLALLLGKARWVTASVFSVLIGALSLGQYVDLDLELAIGQRAEEKHLERVADYMDRHGLNSRPLHYFDPVICYEAGYDPFDTTLTHLSNAEAWYIATEKELLVWDSHFGPNEGRTQLATLLKDPSFRVLHWSQPDTVQNTLGDYPYEVVLFEKRRTIQIMAVSPLVQLDFTKEQLPTAFSSSAIDLERGTGRSKQEFIEFMNAEAPLGVDYGVMQFQMRGQMPEGGEAYLVLSIQKGEHVFRYVKKPLTLSKGWSDIEMEFVLPPAIRKDANYKLFLWNKSKTNLELDELTINLLASDGVSHNLHGKQVQEVFTAGFGGSSPLKPIEGEFQEFLRVPAYAIAQYGQTQLHVDLVASANSSAEVELVLSVENDELETTHRDARYLTIGPQPGLYSYSFPIPPRLSDNDMVKLYLWNKERITTQLDGVRVWVEE